MAALRAFRADALPVTVRNTFIEDLADRARSPRPTARSSSMPPALDRAPPSRLGEAAAGSGSDDGWYSETEDDTEDRTTDVPDSRGAEESSSRDTDGGEGRSFPDTEDEWESWARGPRRALQPRPLRPWAQAPQDTAPRRGRARRACPGAAEPPVQAVPRPHGRQVPVHRPSGRAGRRRRHPPRTPGVALAATAARARHRDPQPARGRQGGAQGHGRDDPEGLLRRGGRRHRGGARREEGPAEQPERTPAAGLRRQGKARRATGGPGVHVAEQQGVRRAVGRGRHHADADGVHWGRVAARGGDGASRAEPAARRPQLRLRAAAVHEECPAEERVRCRGRHFRRGRGRLVRAAGRARARRLPAGPRAGVRAGGHLRRPGRAGGAARRRARGRAAYLSRDGVRIEGGVRRLQLGVLLRGSAVSSAARAERVRQSAGPPPTSSFLPPLRSWSCRALCMVAWFPCKWSIGAPSATSCLDLPTGHCSAFETQLCRFSSAENLIMDGASPHMLDLWLPLRLKCCRLLCGMTLPMEIDAKVQARGHECAKIATMTSSRIAVDPSSRSRLTFSCSSYRRLLTEQLDRAFPRWGSHSPSFVEGLISQVRRDG
ncbi:unnamed protein product [Prorocentrum cordatum]|uniref:Uncharacterized protein n=1 Tax=Prorocentrum cordatum TaxID=2364126 RepID=A0ABN9VDS7_9DINO|nr:unnamed protein product [Polarella glacialis]